ncbi:MAG: alpha/beta fold hydrolase [Bacteroidia bacterium]
MPIQEDKKNIDTASWSEIVFSLKEAEISAKVKGTGEKVLICFHGYLQNKYLFDQVVESIPAGWQVVSVDLPFFGGSRWLSKDPISPGFFSNLMQAIETLCQGKEWYFMGFSMGGKIAMAMQLYATPKATSVILIAPDGIRSNPWYRLISSDLVGNTLLKIISAYPQPFLQFTAFLHKKKLIDKLSYRVFRANFGTKATRDWFRTFLKVYGGIRIHLNDLKALQTSHPAGWYLIWGRRDQVISPAAGKIFSKKIPQAQIIIPEGGHMIIEDDPFAIRQLLDEILFSLNP